MKLKVGQSLVSAIDATTVIVIRAPETEVSVTCGGPEMRDGKGDASQNGIADPAQQDGTLIGKRYAAEEVGVELLCTKAGTGTLALNGVPLPVRAPKPLPSSD